MLMKRFMAVLNDTEKSIVALPHIRELRTCKVVSRPHTGWEGAAIGGVDSGLRHHISRLPVGASMRRRYPQNP